MKENLINEKKNSWENTSEKEMESIFQFAEEYMYFLNNSKTEREAVNFIIEVLEKNQFKDIETVEEVKIGDKVYFNNRGKSVYAAVIGKEDLVKGIRIIGSHLDSPRLDLKPNPLYEEDEFAYLKTHYYGGIKKYQWTAIPLAIHGVVVKTNGEKVKINIGEDEQDPIFTITDLLPHLAMEQMDKKLKDGINGENLTLLVGSIPQKDTEIKEKVKQNILQILNEKYGMREIDFTSSELEIVPAFNAKSLGFDKSMVAGYGQDDKVCAYTSLRAILEVKEATQTAVAIFSDKEEIGSMGNTGMESHMFDLFISELLNKTKQNGYNVLEKLFGHSKMLSADVDAGLDPLYANVSERNNAAFCGKGVGINKYTGARGKSGASDANAEYVAEIRAIFEKENIPYQVSELGKVDVGGGGTIAYILANKGIDVIDCGIPVLSMHAPYEVTSKVDIYCAYQAYRAFWNY